MKDLGTCKMKQTSSKPEGMQDVKQVLPIIASGHGSSKPSANEVCNLANYFTNKDKNLRKSHEDNYTEKTIKKSLKSFQGRQGKILHGNLQRIKAQAMYVKFLHPRASRRTSKLNQVNTPCKIKWCHQMTSALKMVPDVQKTDLGQNLFRIVSNPSDVVHAPVGGEGLNAKSELGETREKAEMF